MQSVVLSHFNDLRRQKAAMEKRDLSMRTVARETEIALSTLIRVASSDTVSGVRVSTIEKLCGYFGVGIGELIEYRKD